MNRIYRWFSWLLVSALLLTGLPVTARGEWYAEYFDNAHLAGGPVLTRYEARLHFDWGKGSPGAGVPADNFSARFTRDVWFAGGTYRFSYRSDDGARVWIGGTLVIDDWRDRAATWDFVDHYIPAGVHPVRVEYYEHTGYAALQVAWEKLVAGATWRGEYFDNPHLQGPPVLVRDDLAVDFNWGTGSPDPVIPADNFSARWTRTLGFEAGTYRFYVSSDDGARVFVNGQLVVDAWHRQSLPNTHHGDITLSAGQHTIIVEYFEEGGEAHAHVWWDRLGTFSGWEGRYYDNNQFRGGPAFIRDDAEINFDWGDGAPTDWIPSDDFSIIWTRTLHFTPGLYRFNVRTDDGMRLWLNDTELLMDYWEPHDNVWHYRDWHFLEGANTLRLEYFEEAGNASIQFWWDYAATVEAARAFPPSPTYGFSRAPTPARPVPPTPDPTQPSAPATEGFPGPWRGEYFIGRDLSQTPVLVRTDAAIDFDWGWGSPAPEIPVDHFAARWTGEFDFEGGRYRFTTTTDDGVRLYLNDDLLIDSWQPMRGSRYRTLEVPAGRHTVRVEYFEATQAARARVTWTRISGTRAPSPTPVPPTACGEFTWAASYFDNVSLAGEPVLTQRFTGPLDFDWGLGSPGDAVPDDNFSAHFETTHTFAAGTYRFTTTSDDGVRLYIDGEPVINSWYPMRGTRTRTVTLPEGEHTLRLEYFERTGAANVRLECEMW